VIALLEEGDLYLDAVRCGAVGDLYRQPPVLAADRRAREGAVRVALIAISPATRG
jgi:hypothetical protein